MKDVSLASFVSSTVWPVCRTSSYQDVVTDGRHLERATDLVEQAYANTGLPVYLGGHSNGPLYALALLHSKSAAWRARHIGKSDLLCAVCISAAVKRYIPTKANNKGSHRKDACMKWTILKAINRLGQSCNLCSL